MQIPEPGVLQTSERYFFTPSSLAEELFYYPTRCGHYFCDGNYHFSCQSETALQAGHRLNLMLLAVEHGALALRIEGALETAYRGEIVLFDCRQEHEYQAEDGTEFFWLLFNGSSSEAFYRRILQSRNMRHAFAPPDYTDTVRGIARLVSACASGERLTEASCSQLLHRILCGLLLAGERAAQPQDNPIARAIRYMNKSLSGPLSVQEVAQSVNLSPSHFSRLFKGHTGYSPYEYIVLRRLDEAKYLLTDTSLSVKEIAYRVGYNSEENFIHSFQKKVGVSPSVFREYTL